MVVETNLHHGIGIVRGDKFSLRRLVDAIPSGATLSKAWLTVKAAPADADPGTFQKEITTSNVIGTGEIEEDGSGTTTGTGLLRFDITDTNTLAMTADAVYYFDIQVLLSTGDIYTLEFRSHISARAGNHRLRMKITTAPTMPSTERVTQNQIINRFLRETESGGYGTVTAVGTTNNMFYDTTSLRSGQYTEEELEKCWIRISGTTGDAAPYGEIRPVEQFDPALGRVTVNPPFSSAVLAGSTYQFFRWPHPQKLLDHIDTILTEETWLPTMAICTEMPDGDMEMAGTADWTASNATIAKLSTEPKGNGRRYLRVRTTAADGYATGVADIFVEPGETFHLSAMTRGEEGAISRLIAYDQTQGAEIDSISVQRLQWVRPYIDLEIPDGCNQLQIRIGGPQDAAETFWDDICLFPVAESSMGLPNYIESRDQIKKVFRLIPEEMGNQNDVWSADFQMRSENGWDFYEDGFTGRNRLRTRLTHSSMPLAIYAMRKEEAFDGTSSDYKALSSNWIHAELCVKVYDSMSSWPGAGTLDSKWIERKLKDFEAKRNQERYKNAMRMDKIWSAPPEQKYVG